MLRVHVTHVIFAAILGFILQGCASGQLPTMKPLNAHPASNLDPFSTQKIVRFSDSLGAVVIGQTATSEDVKLQSMIAAFDYCGREQRLAFVTPPLSYSSHVNYSHVSTYSMRFSDEASSSSSPAGNASAAFIAPFECIDQKHSVKTGLAESEDVPANALRHAVADTKGGVIVHRVTPTSKFRENDIVVSVGAFRVESRGELVKAVDISPVGDLDFTVLRNRALIHLTGPSTNTTASVQANALSLLEALCKETTSQSPSCLTHAFTTHAPPSQASL